MILLALLGVFVLTLLAEVFLIMTVLVIYNDLSYREAWSQAWSKPWFPVAVVIIAMIVEAL